MLSRINPEAPVLSLPSGRAAEEAVFCSELHPGRTVFLLYRDDPAIWHAALVLWPTSVRGTFHILTPDGDVYEEGLLAKAGEGVEKVALGTMLGVPPPTCKLRRHHIYNFTQPLSNPERRDYIHHFRAISPELPPPPFWVTIEGQLPECRAG